MGGWVGGCVWLSVSGLHLPEFRSQGSRAPKRLRMREQVTARLPRPHKPRDSARLPPARPPRSPLPGPRSVRWGRAQCLAGGLGAGGWERGSRGGAWLLGASEAAGLPSRPREEAARSRRRAGAKLGPLGECDGEALATTVRPPTLPPLPFALVLSRGSPALRRLPPQPRFLPATSPYPGRRGCCGLPPGQVLTRPWDPSPLSATPREFSQPCLWVPEPLQRPLTLGLRAFSFPPRCGLNSRRGGSPSSSQFVAESEHECPLFSFPIFRSYREILS